MLVTSSQISVAISSGVVFIFTSLLFLSGYVLQQKTIHSIQAAIHPVLTPPNTELSISSQTPPSTNPVLAKHFGRPPGHSFYDKYLASNRPAGGWAKAAYVQLVRQHIEVCNAVMMFKELAEQESQAQRVIMFPSEWWDDDKKGDISSQTEDDGKRLEKEEERRKRGTTRRLLRQAAKQHKVMLQPIDPKFSKDAPETGTGKENWTPEERFPLTNLLSLFSFNRVIFLRGSGLLIDVTPMDLLFTLPLDAGESIPRLVGRGDGDGNRKRMLGLTDSHSQITDTKTHEADILILEPSKQSWKDTVASLPEGAYLDAEFLHLVPIVGAPVSSPSPSDSSVSETENRPADTSPTGLLTETNTLKDADAQFVADDLLDGGTAYVRIWDEGLPGPEFDVGGLMRGQRKGQVPITSEARKAWVGARERYRLNRMDVCGLDLEPFVESSSGHGVSGGIGEKEEQEGEGEDHELQ